MNSRLVQILEGNTFVVSDARGDIEASAVDPTGLFSFDTRFLSHWVLTVNGTRLNPLSVDDERYFESRFFLVPGTGTVYVDAKLSVIRVRTVGLGFCESLTFINHDATAVDLDVRLEAACDFADLFEVKDALKKKGTYAKRVDGSDLVLRYERETFVRETRISSSEPCTTDENGMTFSVHLGPSAQWKTDINVQVGTGLTILFADEAGVQHAGRRSQRATRPRLRQVDRQGTQARVVVGPPQGDVSAKLGGSGRPEGSRR